MLLTQQDLQELTHIAISAAKSAGNIIKSCCKKNISVSYKNKTNQSQNKPVGGSSLASQVVTEIDIKSQKTILKIIYPTIKKYDLALLSEELVDDKSRFIKDFFWSIDPLDGTLPFTEGREGYSVCIALVSKSGEAYIGVVHDPINNNTYWACKNEGAHINDSLLRPSNINKEFCLITDRSFVNSKIFDTIYLEFEEYAKHVYNKPIKLINQGGAAMNAIWALQNNPACYFKFPKTETGGGSLWDFAATSAIFNELNLPATDIFGEKLDLNRNNSTFMNHKGVLYTSSHQLVEFIQFLHKKIYKSL